jgi:hypothetical protein
MTSTATWRLESVTSCHLGLIVITGAVCARHRGDEEQHDCGAHETGGSRAQALA